MNRFFGFTVSVLATGLLFSCSSDLESAEEILNKVSGVSSLTYGGKTYKTVEIGTQTWMAENLNYAPSSSSGTIPCDIYNCDLYGRLYDWSTAMGFDSSCNSSTCSNQIRSPHRGICPSGWHIPSNAEWDKLYRYADSTNGSASLYKSSTAGKYLKAKNGWSSCGPSGSGSSYSCEDTHGFSALPGGNGYSNGSFGVVGSFGYWWSANEYNSGFAHNRYIRNLDDAANLDYDLKDNLYSVRCVKD
jgi:uncharacterized protein (TIGR02145 family)